MTFDERSTGGLTPRVARRVRRRFSDEDAPLVLEILRDWRLSYESHQSSERLVAALVLISDGDLQRLDEAIALAEADWRDLLVVAELADAGWERRLDQWFGAEE